MSLKTEANNTDLLRWLAKRIKELRVQKNLTQLQCFHDTNVHIGRIEQGKRDISFTTLIKICDCFNITPEEVFKRFDDFPKK
ncbi:helix-turn-helix domain-containing protein [Flavobacterium beibuense]|uniref:helix-turn-helix domain-containing protein n=1 Tax=Flavobacterium beibuense TaxID=657326 RepID=UPI003A9380B9